MDRLKFPFNMIIKHFQNFDNLSRGWGWGERRLKPSIATAQSVIAVSCMYKLHPVYPECI